MPSTIMSVLILVAFVMPGFIARQVISFGYPRSEPSEGKQLLESIALSSVNYAIFSWLIVIALKHHAYESTPVLIGTLLLILLVSPIFLGIVLLRISETNWVREMRIKLGMANPIPTAWDCYFRKGNSCWVLATLKNGELVGGLYGPKSAASSFPASQDIYLEKLCKLSESGEMRSWVEHSAGAIIQMDNVDLLEFYNLDWSGGDK